MDMIFSSFGLLPGSTVPRSYGELTYNIVRKCQILPIRLYHFSLPSAINESSHCSVSSPRFGAVSFVDFSHSNGYVIDFHCGFNLQFPKEVWHGASFHVLACQLYIFLRG